MRPGQRYYQHRTIHAVAEVLHDRLGAPGGTELMRAAARIRAEIAGTDHDGARVALAVKAEGFNAIDETITDIVNRVRAVADQGDET